ncbi:hypothetical protein P4N68_06290 [Corynebacterium felinum]|uniref:Secreted protein n=1 Tax=Corynebacterium felinum TaxID=131318 RepID=A0ABU2BA69_9CORY|nr:hypothetical protein [Corynebacterium felinum]MDF5820688.1 hypothetical protein [Corynebacterium felinum]MDR7355537.1 hypothetical protein [Corynebacterium felinum]WJY94887.1 hypothetical protein CFELI_06335 [Corynebacterium felinum]
MSKRTQLTLKKLSCILGAFLASTLMVACQQTPPPAPNPTPPLETKTPPSDAQGLSGSAPPSSLDPGDSHNLADADVTHIDSVRALWHSGDLAPGYTVDPATQIQPIAVRWCMLSLAAEESGIYSCVSTDEQQKVYNTCYVDLSWPQTVLCLEEPDADVLIRATHDGSPKRFEGEHYRIAPWRITLDNGAECIYTPGLEFTLPEQAMNNGWNPRYVCEDRTWIYEFTDLTSFAGIDDSNPQWRASVGPAYDNGEPRLVESPKLWWTNVIRATYVGWYDPMGVG